jgi:hypothetical protein
MRPPSRSWSELIEQLSIAVMRGIKNRIEEAGRYMIQILWSRLIEKLEEKPSKLDSYRHGRLTVRRLVIYLQGMLYDNVT